jgi:hypothetical protein
MGSAALEIVTGARIGDFAALHIDPIEINDLIEIHGVGAELRKAVANPNQRIETHAPRTNGYGRGLSWVYPLDQRLPIIVVLQNRSPKRELVMAGEVTTGQAWALFPIGIHPAEGDLVLPDGEEHVVSETLTRLEQQIDNAKLRARLWDDRTTPAPKIKARPERLLYPEVCCLEGIWWVNEADDGLCQATEGIDYRLKGNVVAWEPGRGPEAGKAYTVRYRAPAAYVCSAAAPIFRAEGGRGMPFRCQVQRLDRWGDPDLRDNA